MSQSTLNPASAGASAPDPTQSADPSQGAGSGQIDPSQGYKICINVGADQTISVSVEPADHSDSSGQDDSQSQQVPTIRAACQVVQDIFRSSGQMNDAGAEQSAMSSAYGPSTGSGSGAMMPPGAGQ